MKVHLVRSALAVLVASASAAVAAGQCMHWDAGVGLVNPVFPPHAFCIHDPGTGRALYLGCGLEVSTWTGSTWQAVGLDFDDGVGPVCEYDDGSGVQLFAAGAFEADILGTPIRNFAKLVGGVWQEAGGGAPTSTQYTASIYTLAVFDDGSGPKLYFGGSFVSTGGLTNSILSWDGATWASVGTGLGPAQVEALCVFDDGSGPALFAAGIFSTAGGALANNIAKWDGNSWWPLGSGVTGGSNPRVSALAAYDDGSGPALYAAGQFQSASGVTVDGIAKWNGASWSALPWAVGSPGLNQFRSLGIYDDGRGLALYVGGAGISLGFGSGWMSNVGRWDGSTWTSLGSGITQSNSAVLAMLAFDDRQGGGEALWMGGAFGQAGGNVSSPWVARWHGGCTHAIDVMCVGDGSFATCPCSNYGGSLRGCANSASAVGAMLSYSGASNPDTLLLSSSGELPTSLSVFLQSAALSATPHMFQDGIVCLGGQIRRLYLKSAVGGTVQAPGAGDLSISQRSAVLGDPLTTGAVRYYQVWYRDGAAGFCTPAVSNITNGLRVVW